MGSHICAGPDGGLVGLVRLVGLVGSVVGIAVGGLDASFVGVGCLTFFLPAAREEEGAAHLVEGGAARVFHPNGTVLPPVDTMDGAPLYPVGVGYVDDHRDDRIPGTVVLLLGTLGGVRFGGGGGVSGGGLWGGWWVWGWGRPS